MLDFEFSIKGHLIQFSPRRDKSILLHGYVNICDIREVRSVRYMLFFLGEKKDKTVSYDVYRNSKGAFTQD